MFNNSSVSSGNNNSTSLLFDSSKTKSTRLAMRINIANNHRHIPFHCGGAIFAVGPKAKATPVRVYPAAALFIHYKSFATTAYLKNSMTESSHENNFSSTSPSSPYNSSINTTINIDNLSMTSYKNNHVENILFSNIKLILSNNGFNTIAQEKIERELYNFADKIGSNKHKILEFLGGFDSSLLHNSKFKIFIFEKYDEILLSLNSLKVVTTEKINNNKTRTRSKKYATDNLFNIIFTELTLEDLLSGIIISLFKSITFQGIPSKENENIYINSELNIAIDIGRYITDRLIRCLYKKQPMDKNNFRYSQYKKYLLEMNDFKILESEPDVVNSDIGFKLIDILVDADMVKSDIIVKGKTEKNRVITLTDTFVKTLGVNLFNKPLDITLNLPMIVKPKDYIIDNQDDCNLLQGGYYLNNELFIQSLFSSNIEQPYIPKMKNNTVISCLNSMMSVPFKINTLLFNFLMENNNFLIPNEHPLMHKKKLTKRETSQYQSYISEKLLQDYILKIAETYLDAPELYFPLKLDFRGRIYNRVTYLSYQGTGLSKALLLFSRPAIIHRSDETSINYLKTYAATCYGQGLDKKSYMDRLA